MIIPQLKYKHTSTTYNVHVNELTSEVSRPWLEFMKDLLLLLRIVMLAPNICSILLRACSAEELPCSPFFNMSLPEQVLS